MRAKIRARMPIESLGFSKISLENCEPCEGTAILLIYSKFERFKIHNEHGMAEDVEKTQAAA